MVKKRGLPKWGENVLCTVTRITPFAAWCSLDEYEREDGSTIEGMIHVSEVAGKWVKDIRKFVKPNKQYVAKVIRIDYQKGHVNLSLKRVSKFDKKEKAENYRREKRAMGMLNQVAKRVGKTKEDVLKIFEPEIREEFEDIFSFFESINDNAKILDKFDLNKDLKDAIMEVVERNFRLKEKTVKAMLKITTLAPDGVNRVKKALTELEKNTGATVKYISAPTYQVELRSKQPKDAEKRMREGIEDILSKIKKEEGEVSYEFIKD